MAKSEITSDAINALGAFLDQEELHGFPVREWTPRQFSKLHPEIKIVVQSLKDLGMSFDNYQTFLTDHWQDIVDVLVPMLPQIILKSCPSKTEDDLDKISWLEAIEVMMGIFVKNVKHIADFFEQRAQLQQKTVTDLTTPS